MTQKNPTQEPHNGRSRTEQGAQVPSVGGDPSGLVDSAKQTASHLASEAKEQAKTRVETKKGRAAEGLSSVANALRTTREEMGDELPFVRDYADRAAEGVQELSRYIETKTLGELVDDAASFARREPALFFGGAFALGLLAGRFLKSSARPPDRQWAEDEYGVAAGYDRFEGSTMYGAASRLDDDPRSPTPTTPTAYPHRATDPGLGGPTATSRPYPASDRTSRRPTSGGKS